MIVQTETKQTHNGDITPEDTAEELTPNQMRERDAAYATIKAISDNTGKPIAAVIADLRNRMMRNA